MSKSILLMRHGQAMEGVPEPSLTALGIKGTEEMGHRLAKAKIVLEKILHSPRARARETAEIMAKLLSPAGGVHEAQGMLPMDAVELWEDRLAEEEKTVMLVGHLPFMENLVRFLVVKSASKSIIKVHTSEVICLNYSLERGWVIDWAMRPGI